MAILHYIQVEADWIDSREAGDMADALGLEPDTLLGKVTRLWMWTRINAAPAGLVGGLDPIRAIEHAAHWTGKRGAFVKAAVAHGGILKWEGDQLLVRGWKKRYGAALEKAGKDAERKRLARASNGRPADIRAPSERRPRVDRDLDQDQEGDLDPPPPTSSVEKPVVVVDRSGKEHDCNTAPGFWAAISALRTDNEFPREIEPPSWSAWYARAAGDVGPELLLQAYLAFRRDDYFQDRGWPTAIFMSDGVWRPRARPPEPVRRRL